MFRRKIIWGIVGLLCVAGLWLAVRPASGPKSTTPATGPLLSARPAPALTNAALRPVANARAGRTLAELAEDFQRCRVSNTTEPLQNLLRRDTALLLENATFDTTRPTDALIPAHLRSEGDPGAYIVQAKGLVNDAFRARLQAAGAEMISYIPNNAWLVRLSRTGADALAAQAEVQAVVPFEPFYKVKSVLLPLAVDQAPLPPAATLNVVLFADARAETVAALRKLGVQVMAEGPSPFGPVVTVLPPSDSLVAIAALPGVQIVERAAPRVPANDLSRVRMGVATDPLVADNYFGLTGTNILVSVTDSGVDATHPDLTGRVFGDSAFALTDTSGHGTHVAGIIAGDGASSATVSNVPGSEVGANFRGKAPGARLFSMNLGLSWSPGLDFDSYAQEQSALTNALIHNNSWTLGSVYDYDITTASYDAAVRDALPGQSGSQPVLFVFAAGNAGSGQGTIQSPGTGKNIITVGALEQLRDITNSVLINGQTNQPWATMTDTDYQMLATSSRGNVGVGVEGEFGRVKPDLAAPGTFVLSARSGQWDEVAYYNITNHQFFNFPGQEIEADGLNEYLHFVPFNAVGFTITATARPVGTNAPVDLLLYVRADDLPTINDPEWVNTVSLPPDLNLEPGALYTYLVRNTSNIPVTFDLTVEVTVTNNLADYYRVLREINDGTSPQYRFETGTSMAAAAVSGMLALMQEFYEQRMGVTNSPALMKALLINGARPTSTEYNLQVRKTLNHQGWGEARLPTSLPASTNATGGTGSLVFFDQSPTNALITGQSQTRTMTLSDGARTRPLRATLVWTDPPGNPAAGIKLVNDLDLVVTNLDSGEVYFGNDIGASDFSQPLETNAIPTFDAVNNVESIILPPPLGTNYAIAVYARAVNVNAVTAHTNGVAQDYALVISSGDGEVADALTVADVQTTTVSTWNVTTMTNILPDLGPNTEFASLLFNQHVGANSPMLVTTNGATEQWHFYVLTNSTAFTNAAFITFLPPTLSVPRMGVRASNDLEISRFEADIDMYVTTDAALTNLGAAALGAAIRSVGRGGTEFVVLNDAVPGAVYYVGIKAEDQMAAEYAFFGAFTELPFSEEDEEGNLHVRGFTVPATIQDGTPARPGAALVFGIATQPITVRRVTITNVVSHENFGDLLGNLSHNTAFAVLNNHTFGDGAFTQVRVYDDSGEGDITGATRTDGPGSLQNFMGEEGAGLWLLTMVDNAPSQTGRVEFLSLKLEPQRLEDEGDILTVAPNSWAFDVINVPPEATNLTVCLAHLTSPPLPLELYIRRGDFPTLTEFDQKVTVSPPGGCLTIDKSDLPPLQGGRYYIGVFNPNSIAQTVRLTATIELDLNGIVPVVYTSTDVVPLLDDAVTFSEIVVSNEQRIAALDVGVVIRHPRVSDLALQLVSPEDKRVLLFENRGGLDTNGLGAVLPGFTTNVLGTVMESSFEGLPPAFGIPAGNSFLGWTVDSGDVDLLSGNSSGFIGPSHTGTNCLDINGFVGGAVSTNFVTQSNALYRLSFAYTKNPGGPGGYVPTANVFLGSNLVCSVAPNWTNTVTTLNWQTTSVVYQATSPLTKLELASTYAGNAGVFFDTILVEQIEIVSNRFEYFTFTEDTNKEPTLLKFTPPPFAPLGGGVILSSGFETATPGSYASPAVVEGWTVADTNEVGVVADAPNAYDGSQFLALADGRVTRTIPTQPGRDYVLQFAYRGPGIAGWWRGEGNGVDSAGGNTATLLSGTTFGGGEVGQAFLFDGVNDSVRVLASPALDVGTGAGFTIELWANPSKTTAAPLVEWNNAVGTIGVHLWQGVDGTGAPTTGTYYANILDTTGGAHLIATAQGFVQTNVYQHVALTYDKSSGVAVIYVNGVAVQTQNLGVFTPRTAYNLDFGRRASGVLAGTCYQGQLDEVSIYNRALSPAELKAIYLRGSVGKFDAAAAAPLNLAKAAVVIGSQTNVFFGDAGWQTQVVPFRADSSSTLIEFQGLAPGLLLDDVSVTEQARSPFVFPEETLDSLKGDLANGTWRLEVWDSRVGATNPAPELLSWNLSFVFEDNRPAPTVLTPGVAVTNSIPPGEMLTFVVDVPLWATVATNTLIFSDLPLLVWFNQTGAPVGAAPPDTLFFGGPATNGVEALTVPGTPPLQPGQRYYLGLQNTNTATATFAFRVDFDITALTNGVPYIATTGTNGQPRYFTYTVSSNATAVLFDLFGMDGNLNLVASQGAPLPDLNSFDYGSFNPGTNDEQIIVFTNSAPVALQPGVWYLGVFNPSANAINYNIRATEITNVLPTIITLTNMVPYMATNADVAGSAQYYRYPVTASAARVQFETFGADGDVTLVARRGLPLPDLLTFDYRSANAGTNDELIVIFTNSTPVNLTAGDWFITAVNLTPGPIGYTIMASEWSTTGQPIDIIDFDFSTGDFCITWNSLPGVHYYVERTFSLSPPAWFVASPNITAVDFTTTWCFPFIGDMSFFRVVEGIVPGPVAATAPTFSNVTFGPGGVSLTWFGPLNAQYEVQWTPTLSPPNWTSFVNGIPVTSTNGIFNYVDDGSETGGFGPMRFYRLIQLP